MGWLIIFSSTYHTDLLLVLRCVKTISKYEDAIYLPIYLLNQTNIGCAYLCGKLQSHLNLQNKNLIHTNMEGQLTDPQLKIIQQYASQSQDMDILAIRISQVIKHELGIIRTAEEIINQLLRQNSRMQDEKAERNEKRGVDKTNNLFKTFEDHNRIQVPIASLARPVPVRKTSILILSKRKVQKREQTENRSNWSLQQRLNQIEHINQQCTYTYDKYERKINKKTSIKQQNQINYEMLWFYHQFFYSNYDRKYFQGSVIKEVYHCLGYQAGEVKFWQHKAMLKVLPKPKVFNEQFISEEKSKLDNFRNTCRVCTKNLSKSNQNSAEFPVHSIVLALHPMCGHLHTGSIMALYKQNLYMVRFLKPQLPVHKVLDICMSTQFTSLSNKGVKQQQFDRQRNQIGNTTNNSDGAQSEIVENINFQVTGYLLKILEFKADLVKIMRNINDRLDRKENVAPEVDGQRELGKLMEWLIGVAGKVDVVVKQALIRFRLRGVNESNTSSIFGNLKQLLINPLKIMSKQFENSNEQVDLNAAEQIKQIINKERDVKIKQIQSQIRKALNNAIILSNNNNKNNNEKESTLNSKVPLQTNANDGNNGKELQLKMMPLVYSCLGILADLRYEGKEFDVENNGNLLKLADLAGKENTEAFNEVYERLYSIVAKVKE